ncbi:YecA family protein [Psychrobacter sp.]|uniref:YecA/YgfB family protein n=1 Tax=Psychrobacter sp. TaxID=56811 RepID=UPI0025CE0036|nr:YecA family protein [Psychrobacter sp.]
MTLEELQNFLDSEDNVHGLDSVATHGFLTATIVGMPLPNWLSLLFEGQESKVNVEVKAAITAWREALLEDIHSEEGIALPLDIDDDSGEMDFSPESELTAWSIGFVDAMYGDENVDWFSDEENSEDVAMLTLPMMVFSGIDTIDGEEDEDLAAIRRDEDALAQMANSIEGNLSELFLLFHTTD